MPQLVLEVSRNEVGNPQQEPMYHKNILSGTAGLNLLRWAVKPRPRTRSQADRRAPGDVGVRRAWSWAHHRSWAAVLVALPLPRWVFYNLYLFK